LRRAAARATLLATLWLLASAAALAQGSTVAIGGALKDNNHAIWQRLVDLAGGPGARFAVFATASGEPDRTAESIITVLKQHGAVAEHIRVGPRFPGQDLAQAVQDPQWLDKVRGSKGVFFSGGAQSRLIDTLKPGGRDTPLLQAVRAVWAAGGVVAGTSSGAAVLADVIFRDAPDVLAVMKGQLREGQEVDRGFGFFPPQVAVDQHFIRRGRIGRLLPLMQTRALPLGIGVEENSAVVLRGDEIEAIGEHGALVADLSQARNDPQWGAFNLSGARLHWLASGDSFNLATRVATPGAAKRAATRLDPSATNFRGYHSGPAFYADILTEGLIVKAMARLVDGDQTELRGLSFAARPAQDDPAPDIGFEWRLHRGPGTLAWWLPGSDNYTVVGVILDIVPVRLAQPWYQPLRR